MLDFARWLAATDVSAWIQVNTWVIPAVQSIHILAIGIVFGSIFLVDTKVLGITGRSQTLRQITARFAPWFWGGLAVLLVTGTILTIGEPVRELMTLSFRIKMVMIVLGSVVAAAFLVSVRRREAAWEERTRRGGLRVAAVLVLLLWVLVIVFGRLIAWDTDVFGALSPYPDV